MNGRHLFSWLGIFALLACFAFAGPAGAAIWYVDNSLGTNGSGTSAGNALNNLQDAITLASASDVIWVTEGTYQEGVVTLNKQLTLAGGFNHAFTDRDISGTPTIIDGQGVSRSTGEVRINTDSTLDGLTITGGNNSNGYGGGIEINNVSPTITSCTITANDSTGVGFMRGGGGIGVRGGSASPYIGNCVISDNTLTYGASTIGGCGVLVYGSATPTFEGCTIVNNTGTNTSSNLGSGVLCYSGAAPTFINCVIAQNGNAYGAIACRSACNVTVTNCTIDNNLGSGFYTRANTGNVITVTNTIISNHNEYAYYNYDTDNTLVVKNCLWHNNGSYAEEGYVRAGSLTVTDLGGNVSGKAPFQGGAYGQRTYPFYTDPSTYDYSLAVGSAAIDRGASGAGIPTDDIAGNGRSVDGNTFLSGAINDIGAYEFQSSGSWDDSALATMYVKVGGTGDGSSWADAFGEVDDVDQALNGVTTATIWVAAGTYTVDANITVEGGQTWLGGFPNTGDPGLGDRDSGANETILQSTGGTIFYFNDAGDVDVTVDGFIAERGGVAVNMTRGEGTFNNCVFRNNSTSYGCLSLVPPLLETTIATFNNCQFLGNVGGRAGIIWAYMADYGTPGGQYRKLDMRFYDCVFAANEGTGNGRTAGTFNLELDNGQESRLHVERCIFAGNRTLGGSEPNGGAIKTRGSWDSIDVINCAFVGNSAVGRGGAVDLSYSGRPDQVVNCTFIGNKSLTSYGGALVMSDSTNHKAINNIFIGNEDVTGSDALNGNCQRACNIIDPGQDDPVPDSDYSVAPALGASTTGSFSSRTYDSANNMTTLVGSGFTPGALVGKIIMPDDVNTTASVIVSNTATDIVVPGNFSGGASNFEILDLTPTAGSPAIDRGVFAWSGVDVPTDDIAGNARPAVGNESLAASIDVGAYEVQSASAVAADLYVKVGGVGDGSSWANACDIDYAVANAGNGDIIWLAAGDHQITTTPWDLPDNVKIVGGFPATGNPTGADIDTDANVSAIDGNNVVRSKAFIEVMGATSAAFEGITFKNANNRGDDDLSDNSTNARGGGLRIYNTMVTVNDCSFEDNTVYGAGNDGGAGIYLELSAAYQVNVTNTEFLRNTAVYDPDNSVTGNNGGGGIRLTGGGKLVADGCLFLGNYGARGAGIYDWASVVEATNCAFIDGNHAHHASGIWVRYGATVSAVGCTFANNRGGTGPAIWIWSGSGIASEVTMLNCIVANNPDGYAINSNQNTVANVFRVGNCLFDNNAVGDAAGDFVDLGGNISIDPDIGGVGGTYTYAGLADPMNGNVNLVAGSAAIDTGASSSAFGTIPTTDMDGNARDVDMPGVGGSGAGNAYDIGAVERVSTAIPSSGIVYVNDNAVDGGDGTIGAPIKSVQNAIDLLQASPPAPWNATNQVYVAGGTYYEHLLMEANSAVRGGFSEDFSSRDASAYPTILDGEDTAYSGAMVRFYNSAGARLDGFTVQNGYSNISEGGGVYINCQAEVTSCVVRNNLGGANWLGGGGGFRLTGSADALIDNCWIHDNNVIYRPSNNNNDGGGGICAYGGSVNALVRDTRITSNSSGRGGGIMCAYSTVQVENSVIAQNMVRDTGSAAFLRYGGSLTMVNTTIDGNHRLAGSTTAIYQWASTDPSFLSLTNCIVSNSDGAGVSGNNGDHTHVFANNLFHNNGGTDVSESYYTDLGGNISKESLGGSSSVPTAVFFADRANWDYSLAPGSNAVDAGLTTDTAPTVDLAGNARDWDVPGIGASSPDVIDIGAYELRSNAMPDGIYVDDDSPAPGSGSKAAPFTYLGDGVAAAEPNSPWPNQDVVHVAGGTYTDLVSMLPGMAIRGGYDSSFATRDLSANESIIDGQGVHRSSALVYFSSDDVGARIDGMTIYNNYRTSDDAGGIYVSNCPGAIITSCTIDSNRTRGGYLHGGGGIGVVGSNAQALIANCTVTSNSTWSDTDSRFDYQYPGTFGGGVLVYGGRSVIENSRISGNLSSGGSAIGGNSAHIALRNSIVDNNVTLEHGWNQYAVSTYHRYGGDQNSLTTITQCTFYNNTRLNGTAGDFRTYVYTGDAPDAWTTATIVGNIFAEQEGQSIASGTGRQHMYVGYNVFHNCGDAVGSAGQFFDLGGNVSRDGTIGGLPGVFTNPLFADAANGDFTPTFGSAAIDKSPASLSGIAGLPYDFNYAARDYDVVGVGGEGAGNAYDSGAIENQSAVLSATTIYVDDDAAVGGDGTIGAPFQTLNEGLDTANPEWLMDVKVAGGTYYETMDMTPDLLMAGGYSADFLSRDFEATPSIIDGQKDITTRTRALVWFKGGDSDARLDGFTVQNNRNAFGDWEGGAISVENADATITSCVLQSNFCLSGNVKGGGGVYMGGGSSQVSIANTTMFNNFVQDTDPTKGNDGGGGVIVYAGADLVMSDCLITSNRAGRGGGIYVRSTGSSADVYNTIVGGNVGWNSGGGLWFRDEAEARFVNCTISGNSLESSTSDGVYYWGVDSSYGPCNTVFINNIFEGHANRCFQTRSGHYIELRNNLFDSNGDDYYGAAPDVATNNISVDPDIGGTAGTNTNPALMYVPGVPYRYIIMAGSQAIDAGLSVGDVPPVDYLGFARDASPDIGAVEYDPTPTSPTIVIQPVPLVLDPGDAGALSVSAMGTPLLHYQWEFDGGSGWVNVGLDASSLTIDPAEEADDGSYRVTVTNAYGTAVSDVVTVTVNDPPVITVEPVSVHTTPGSSASFSVTVTGTAPMTFQWQKDGALADIDSDHVVTSTDTGSTYLFTDVQPDDPGVYRVQVTNSAGMARSVYVVLSVDGPVLVLRQPTTQTTSFGADATFTIFVSGSQPMTYAWTRNGAPLSDGGNVSGATTNELTIDPVDWADAMGVGYQVTVTNAFPGSGVSPIVGIRLLPTGVSPWWEMMK